MAWNASERKQAIVDELKERGVLLDALREAAGNRDIDDFDLICHIAFDKKPLTKADRRATSGSSASGRTGWSSTTSTARSRSSNGIADLDKVDVLTIDPFRKIGTTKAIVNAFGGKQAYLRAVRELQNQIYAAA